MKKLWPCTGTGRGTRTGIGTVKINAHEMSNAKNNQINLRKEHILRKSSINLWIPMLLIAHAAVGTMIKTENKEQSENMQHIVTESNQIIFNDTEHISHATEIQKAVCTVTAGEVRASAEAVTTKTLKGVCGSDEMKHAFSDLKNKLYHELEEIKKILRSLRYKCGTEMVLNQNQQNNNIDKNIVKMTTTFKPEKFQTIASDLKSNDISNRISSKMKSLSSEEPVTARDRLLNNVRQINKAGLPDQTSADLRVFTYHWKIEMFTKRLDNQNGAIMDSPTFTVGGRALCIRAHFHHLHRDFLYLQLIEAKSALPSTSSITLDMGNIFKEIANENNFNFKHRISVLDQNHQGSKDLVSQEYSNLEAGFLIPNTALLESPYLKHDTLLIQIFLYL
uniref:MATH domain-containing protein n=1 Tax=Glossina pallidipes TaxID=7398 RepID=A0A1A9ZU30_GLOPL